MVLFTKRTNQAPRQGLERVVFNRVHPIEHNRSIPGLCWFWIGFTLNQFEANPLWDAPSLRIGADMDFQQLRFVIAVADTNSFTTAADLCWVTQPALSNAVAQLQVGDDCGLSTAVRGLFGDQQMKLGEYEGRAMGYGALEKWVSLGIRVTLLPASKVADISRSRRLKDRSGDAVSIGFCACWTAPQEQRPSCGAMRRVLVAGAK